MDSQGRRRNFIAGPVQRRLLLAYGIHALMVVGVFVAALYIPSLIIANKAEPPTPQAAELAKLLLALNHQLLPALLVVLAITAVSAVLVTHRVAGPLVQIHRVSERIQDGSRTARIQLRKHDYLKPEAKAINAMLDALTSAPQSTPEPARQPENIGV